MSWQHWLKRNSRKCNIHIHVKVNWNFKKSKPISIFMALDLRFMFRYVYSFESLIMTNFWAFLYIFTGLTFVVPNINIWLYFFTDIFWNCSSYLLWIYPILPHSKKVVGSNPGQGISMWSLDVLPLSMWVFSRNSGFLPLSKNMQTGG